MDEHSGAGKLAPTRLSLVGFLAGLTLLCLGTSQAWMTRPASAETGSATFGKTAVGAKIDKELEANHKLVNSATLSVPGSVTKLSLYAIPGKFSPSPQALKAVIYADAGGSPGALVATGTEVTYKGDTNGSGWLDLPFGSPVALSPGSYWLGVLTSIKEGGMGFRYDLGASSHASRENLYALGPSDPFGPPTMSSVQVSIYATYTPTASSSVPTISASGPSAPAASFQWFPATPHVGEPVSLVSTSTDLTSPITAYAWDLTETGSPAGFKAGGPVISTTFSTPGNHLVRMRVTDGNGLSSIAMGTIHTSSPPATIMRPFPIVRIVGTDFANGVKIRLLAVEAPTGARITVACQGRRCPLRSRSKVAQSGSGGSVWVTFRRLERFLRAGVVLEIRVSRGNEIGSYTRFVIRRRMLPTRLDTCLDPAGIKPLVCPS